MQVKSLKTYKVLESPGMFFLPGLAMLFKFFLFFNLHKKVCIVILHTVILSNKIQLAISDVCFLSRTYVMC